MQSLANKTLILLCIGGWIAAAVVAIFVFLLSQRQGEQRAKADVAGYADLVSQREAERFAVFGGILAKVANTMAMGLSKVPNKDLDAHFDEAQFDALFPPFGDGTRRSSSVLFDGVMLASGLYVSGFAAFMPDERAMTQARKATLWSAFQAMTAHVSLTDRNVKNLFFVSPHGDILAYGPTYPEAMMVYRKYAPGDFGVFDGSYIQRPSDLAQSSPTMTCSNLLGFAQRSTAQSPAITCQVPVSVGEGVQGSFGITLITKEIFGTSYDHALRLIDVFLLAQDGTFITAPTAALQSSLDVVGQGINSFDDPVANWRLDQKFAGRLLTSPKAVLSPSGNHFIATRVLAPTRWTMVFAYPTNTVWLDALNQAGRVFVAGVALTLFVCLLTMVALRHAVSKPLSTLSRQADALAKALGRDSVSMPSFELPTQRLDEIGALSRSFETLADTALKSRNVQNALVERRTSELELQASAAREAADAADRLLTGLSHEVRTPANAIVGFAAMLDADLADGLPAQAREHLDLIVRNADALSIALERVVPSQGSVQAWSAPGPSSLAEEEPKTKRQGVSDR